MPTGLFITLEGGEGSGKSTHAALLAKRLQGSGLEIVSTREPGGPPEAETIRKLLLSGDRGLWSANAEVLLNYAAREIHLVQTIRPALARGAIVICDRFMDSTRAYQGAAGGADMALIDRLESLIVGATRPDLTLLFDIDPIIGLERAGRRRHAADRFEGREVAFHEALRRAFLDSATREPARFVIVESAAPKEQVRQRVWGAVAAKLPR